MKGPRYFIDSNIFLRIIAKDSQVKLRECETLVIKISQNKINASTSSLVLTEVVWTCLKGYKLMRNEVKEVIKSITGIKNLRFEDKMKVSTAAEMFDKHNIKFADCLIASHPKMVQGDMIIVSYDRDFDKLGIKRLEPAEVI